MSLPVSQRVPAGLDGERIDRVVALAWNCSRAEAARLVDTGAVRINAATVTARSQRVVQGDVVELLAEPLEADTPPEPDTGVDFTVLYCDEHVVVLEKPAGLVVHPGAGNTSGTLVHGLLARFPEMRNVGDPTRPGIVHRLDRGTSGLMLAARSTPAHRSLSEALAQRQVHRSYEALVAGVPASSSGVVDAPIGRSNRHPTRMSVAATGREARTHYEVQEPLGEAARLRLRLETGRTHQIRVHLSAIGHPVIGDSLYGGPSVAGLDRPALHATGLRFVHPMGDEPMEFTSQPPPDMNAAAATLRSA